MEEYEVKPGAQWSKNLIPTLNTIFSKLSEKIDGVNINIEAVKLELIEKIDNIQKTADNALKIANENKRCTEEMKEEIKKELRKEFKKYFHKNYCENLESENVNLKGRRIKTISSKC